jgi:hypothetical protein
MSERKKGSSLRITTTMFLGGGLHFDDELNKLIVYCNYHVDDQELF